MRKLKPCSLIFLVFSAPAILGAGIINFDTQSDSTILTNQYPGVTFANAIILTAGISLNEFEFPPHSGMNVASDNGGPMSLSFSSPVQNFSGYFTYSEALTLQAFGTANTLVASINSAFLDNEALSGVSGSSPNELLQVNSSSGIMRISIAGDPAGGSFALDDATFSDSPSMIIPEPSSSFVLISGMFLLIGIKLVRRIHEDMTFVTSSGRRE